MLSVASLRPGPSAGRAVAAARGAARRFAADRRGQSLVFAAFTLFGIVVMGLMIVGVERTTTQKIRVQNAADAATLAAVHIQADAVAHIAWINEAMASIYYDLMAMCVDTATAAVQAQLADPVDLVSWREKDVAKVVRGGVPLAPPSALVPAGAVAYWRALYAKARERVPRAEKWLRRLGQVERTIALLAPELMRHQMMYTARRNLVGDAASPADIRDRVRVASYPDLNRVGIHEAGEAKTFSFLSDEDADFNKAVITKIGDPGEFPNGWIFDATETNQFRMSFRHDAQSGDGGITDADSGDSTVRQFFQWDARGAQGWNDTWSASVTQGENTLSYEIKFHDREDDKTIRNLSQPYSHDYLIRTSDGEGNSYEKLIRHKEIEEPEDMRYTHIQRVEVLDRVKQEWTVIETYTYARTVNSPRGGLFDERDMEICIWMGNGTDPSSAGPPDQRVKVKADGESAVWNEDAGKYEDPPESFSLTDVGGIQVPADMAGRFYVGGPLGGTVIGWNLPLTLWFFNQRVTLSDPMDIAYNTNVGCHGYVHFSPDDKAAHIHGLSTLTPDKDWSAPHHDRRRHRLYADDEVADRWIYEWIDAGPILRDMPGKRFGYHALMDRTASAPDDYVYPRPDEHEEQGWRGLLRERPEWPLNAYAATGRSFPSTPPTVPVWAFVPEPEDPDAPDEEVAAPDAAEPFGGWFDIGLARPYDINVTTGPGTTRAHNIVGLSRTVPCWYCGDKGDRPGAPLVDLADPNAGLYTRGQPLGGGAVSGCGFWHESFGEYNDYEARATELRNAGASFESYSEPDPDNPEAAVHYIIQVRCPLGCTRDWSDGSRPAQLGAFGKYRGKAATEIPTHVRVTLFDASTYSWTHPLNANETVMVAVGATPTGPDAPAAMQKMPASANRPRRLQYSYERDDINYSQRAPDYGYVHEDKTTHWTRDYFGVHLTTLRNRTTGESMNNPAVMTENPSLKENDIKLFDFWDQTRPPLEVHSVTGELFRGGLTLVVWSELDDWLSDIWPVGRAPVKGSAVGEGHREAVRMELDYDEPRGAIHRVIPPAVTHEEREWTQGRFNPIEEVPWNGMFAFSSARVFYPEIDYRDGKRGRYWKDRRYDFPWENTDVDKHDLLEQVVNPLRDEWLDSPMNLFDPNWSAALVPLGAAVDMRDLELGEMSGETDLQYFLRRRLMTSPFRHSVAAGDNRDIDRVNAGALAGPHQTLRWRLTPPPMQKGRAESARVEWFDRHRDGRGLEQVIAK